MSKITAYVYLYIVLIKEIYSKYADTITIFIFSMGKIVRKAMIVENHYHYYHMLVAVVVVFGIFPFLPLFHFLPLRIRIALRAICSRPFSVLFKVFIWTVVHQYRYKLRTVSLCCFAYEWKIHKNLCCQCI